MLNICEKYITISGEAPIIGEPTYLVRFSGCNLSCSYCDSIYKDEVQYRMSLEDIIEDIEQIVRIYSDIKILFTGGEPLLNKKEIVINKIAEYFDYLNFYIETNGSIEISDFSNKNVHYVLDWKTPSSGCANSFCKGNV
ncbi:MAG TPA: radical SAM protein, partial [Spirochaetota bacterium]|nr:radical SAM protein [Spirochaetota bacterium]